MMYPLLLLLVACHPEELSVSGGDFNLLEPDTVDARWWCQENECTTVWKWTKESGFELFFQGDCGLFNTEELDDVGPGEWVSNPIQEYAVFEDGLFTARQELTLHTWVGDQTITVETEEAWFSRSIPEDVPERWVLPQGEGLYYQLQATMVGAGREQRFSCLRYEPQ